MEHFTISHLYLEHLTEKIFLGKYGLLVVVVVVHILVLTLHLLEVKVVVVMVPVVLL
jgi:hypothetical protein